MFKICPQCEQAKHISEYNIRKRRGTTEPQSMCKKCNSEYQKSVYDGNFIELIRIRASNRKIRNMKKDYVASVKDIPCTDCGHRFPSYAMDFDHVRGEKSFNISMAVKTKTLEEIKEEIAKCDVVCATCHRMRTQDRIKERKKEILNDRAIQEAAKDYGTPERD